MSGHTFKSVHVALKAFRNSGIKQISFYLYFECIINRRRKKKKRKPRVWSGGFCKLKNRIKNLYACKLYLIYTKLNNCDMNY